MADEVELICACCGGTFLARPDNRLPRKYCGPHCRKVANARRKALIWHRGRAACALPPGQAVRGEGAGKV